MAAITASTDKKPSPVAGRHITRTYGTGAANQTDTLTSAGDNGSRRLISVTVAYSAAPTQTGVTVAIDSGLGSAYDTTLATGDANARYFVYLPDEDLWIYGDDEIIVTAPAAGGSITASIVITVEGK